MDLREISDAVYAGKSVEKKQAMDLVYYEMADFLNTRATNLQEGIDRYIQILDNIRRDAIKQGATADALDTFISYAKNLSNVVEELGQTAKETCNTFISDVDESDEFLF